MNAFKLVRRPCAEYEFHSVDDARLFYRHWPAVEAGTRKGIVLFHRGHEHGGRMAHLLGELRMPDADFSPGMRGLGCSSGERG